MYRVPYGVSGNLMANEPRCVKKHKILQVE